MYARFFVCIHIHTTIKELVGINYRDHQIVMKTKPAERREIKTQTDIS